MQKKLTHAFSQGNRDSILFYAADISHYIADAHVPLHTTLNYDGQLTNQKGLHNLWESTIPELELEVALHEGWVRYWHRGALLPLPGELLARNNALNDQLVAAQEARLAAEAALARLREEMAKAKGSQ